MSGRSSGKGMYDEAKGRRWSRKRRGSGRGGGGLKKRGDTVQVWGFKMPWKLWSDGERMDSL